MLKRIRVQERKRHLLVEGQRINLQCKIFYLKAVVEGLEREDVKQFRIAKGMKLRRGRTEVEPKVSSTLVIRQGKQSLCEVF